MSHLNNEYRAAIIKRAGVVFGRNACPCQRGKPPTGFLGRARRCSDSHLFQASIRVLVEFSHAFYGDHYAP